MLRPTTPARPGRRRGRPLQSSRRPQRPLASAVLAALALSGCGRSRAEPARHLVLITVDTWRGDHAFAERAGVALTPELERFAAGGTRFTAAASVANATSPGVAGILTGLLPLRSGVLTNPHLLSDRVPTLAAMARAAGLTTAGVVGNQVLRPGMGFEQGFDHYELVSPDLGRPKARADAVTDAALAAADALPRDGRLLLWVHYMDPHGPYTPPAELLELFPAEAFEADERIRLVRDPSGLGGIPPYQQRARSPPSRDGRDYLARYAAEVRFMDREMGRLLAGLEERGLLAAAAVAVTSDHGEALAGDHGYYFSHANGATEDQLQVPLVLVCPGCPAGSVVERPVSTADLLPTLVALLGLEVPSGHTLDGVSLLADEPRPVYARAPEEVSLRSGDWKGIWNLRGGGGRLFDLAADPGELRDLAAEDPERLAVLAGRLRELHQRPVLAKPRMRPPPDPRRARELKALGYL